MATPPQTSASNGPVMSLAEWMRNYQAGGSEFYLSAGARAMLEGILEQGVDPHGFEDDLVGSALASPQLLRMLIEAGAKPTQMTVELLALRCEAMQHEAIFRGDSVAIGNQKAMWAPMPLLIARAAPELDWYARYPTKNFIRQSAMPAALLIERVVKNFVSELEAEEARRGLPVGPQFPDYTDRQEALADLLCVTPELQSLTTRTRLENLDRLLASGAEVDVGWPSIEAGRPPLFLAVALCEGNIMGRMLEAGVTLDEEFAIHLARCLIDPKFELKGLRKNGFADCMRELDQKRNVDWMLMVQFEDGKRVTIGELLSRKYEGLGALLQQERLERGTQASLAASKRPTRL